MNDKRLFIWVEGNDDERFFDHIVKPRLLCLYGRIDLIPYAQMKHKKIKSYLKSIYAMNADCIFTADINSARCISEKKQTLKDKFQNIAERNILIIIKEIESWYLSGLSDSVMKKFRCPAIKATDGITKEKFNDFFSKSKFDSRIDFMTEILKNFKTETAKQKNKSFNYFFGKYIKCQ
ncbi:MAG: hypothetical protein HZA48_10850 [Planctomycetes bacterium]|nr:hypothetical protein [Planctomycetota bacterium]